MSCAVKASAKGLSGNAFLSKKAKLETWQKNILGGMDSFCMLVLLAASAIAISSGKMGVESVTAMIGFYYVFFRPKPDMCWKSSSSFDLQKIWCSGFLFLCEAQERTDGETVGRLHRSLFRNVTFSYDGKTTS